MNYSELSRRDLFNLGGAAAAGLLAGTALPSVLRAAESAKRGSKMRLGLVTYQWAKDWDLPTLIRNCETASTLGVELRTTHAHGVEPALSAEQRKQVKKRFADSPVTLVGLGSNERFDDPDPAKLAKAIEATKAFVKCCHDVGGSGVKVKPNDFHKDVPREKTIEQIGTSLNTLGKFAADYNQQIRLEVHGQCAELPTMKAIMDVATEPNVVLCWNSNAQDLKGKGLEYNFNLVKNRLGPTTHVRELDYKGYPFDKLLRLFVGIDYDGWIMIEASSNPKDRVKALARQAELFKKMLAEAQAKA
ncbi:MAG: sugar phosphate isomerase/epimerase [Phycisphaerae bacterium]|nr:sugar phosphate isomerase/epimerase [Phycisphaerae bacterium]